MTLRELVAMIEKNCVDSDDPKIIFDVDGVVFEVEAIDMYISAFEEKDFINITLS